MGKGGFIGGSSLIGTNGWFVGSSVPTSGRDKPEVTPHLEAPKVAFVHPPKRKRGPKPPQGPLTDKQAAAMELGFLETVIDAHVNGLAIPGIPRKILSRLEKSINDAGGLIPWAKGHSQAASIIDRKLKSAKELAMKSGKNPRLLEVFRVGDSRAPKVATDAENAAKLLALHEEKERLTKALHEAVDLTKKLRDRLAGIEQEMNVRQLL